MRRVAGIGVAQPVLARSVAARCMVARPALACLALACLAMTGCAHTNPVAEAPPAMAIPAAWAQGGSAGEAEWPDKHWWQRFGSAELTRLMDLGQANNLELAAALARVRQAEAQARIAGVALLPTVNVYGDGNRDLPIGASSASSASNYAGAVVQVAYEVDFWGKNKASLASAEASLKANRYDRQTVALTVTSAIVRTYLQVLSLHDRLASARAHVANAEHVLLLVKAQERAGAASPLDLARQRSALAGQQSAIPELQQQRREAQSALAILLGQAPQDFTLGDDGLDSIVLPDVAPGLPSALLSRRPDIRHAEANLAAASADVAVARAALFPNIRLTGALGAQSNALHSLLSAPSILASVSTSLMAPIFDGARLQSERDLAIARRQELLQRYRASVIAALSEVDIVLGQIRSLDEQRRLKVVEMRETQLAFDLSEIRYKVGAEDLMTVLDTQRALSDVQNDLGILKLKRLQATVSLYQALGGGWQDEPATALP